MLAAMISEVLEELAGPLPDLPRPADADLTSALKLMGYTRVDDRTLQVYEFFVRASGKSFTVLEVTAQLGWDRGANAQIIRRLVEKGALKKTSRGVYTAP
jgi:predicted transcriptional regulator of viral defense system